MEEFFSWFSFWWQCFVFGWHLAHQVFGYFAEACGFVGIALLAFKRFIKQRKGSKMKWKTWEERTMKAAFYICALLFLIMSIAVAPFVRYREATTHQTHDGLKKQILSLIASLEPILRKHKNEPFYFDMGTDYGSYFARETDALVDELRRRNLCTKRLKDHAYQPSPTKQDVQIIVEELKKVVNGMTDSESQKSNRFT